MQELKEQEEEESSKRQRSNSPTHSIDMRKKNKTQSLVKASPGIPRTNSLKSFIVKKNTKIDKQKSKSITKSEKEIYNYLM